MCKRYYIPATKQRAKQISNLSTGTVRTEFDAKTCREIFFCHVRSFLLVKKSDLLKTKLTQTHIVIYHACLSCILHRKRQMLMVLTLRPLLAVS